MRRILRDGVMGMLTSNVDARFVGREMRRLTMRNVDMNGEEFSDI